MGKFYHFRQKVANSIAPTYFCIQPAFPKINVNLGDNTQKQRF
jgi:hypothetical protein